MNGFVPDALKVLSKCKKCPYKRDNVNFKESPCIQCLLNNEKPHSFPNPTIKRNK